MATIRRVSELFEPAPAQWGLRGDPWLWAEMAAQLSDLPLPADPAGLDALLAAQFQRLVGTPLDAPVASVFVARYDHGGMSSGMISLGFWRDTGLPLLRSRHATA